MNDIKYAIRVLIKRPIFMGSVLIILGLGIGANTAIFGVWDKVILRPLPVYKPRELVKVEWQVSWDEGEFTGTHGLFHYSDYERFCRQSRLFSGMLAYGGHGSVTLRFRDRVSRQHALAVSGNYFDVFGIKPRLGRMFLPEDDRVSARQSVGVISHAFWHRYFGGDKNVIGRQIIIDNVPVKIVGVAPSKFTGKLLGLSDIFIPLSVWARMHNVSLEDHREDWLHIIGRLKPGMRRKQGETTLRVIATRMREGDPEDVQRNIVIFAVNRQNISGVQEAAYPLPLLMVVSAMLLLITCANIANLQFVHGTTRYKEIAIRRAVGASRCRIVWQLLCESLVLALLGGFCGILMAIWLDKLLCTFLSSTSFFQFTPGVDARILTFALIVSLTTGMAFGITPALQTSGIVFTPALRSINAFTLVPTKTRKFQRLLVIVQVAISIPVLILGGLCARGLFNLHRQDPGFDPARIIMVAQNLQGEDKDLPAVSQFLFDLRERVRDMPTVKYASLAGNIPLGESSGVRGIKHIEGAEIPPKTKLHWIYNAVGPEYFQTLGIPVLRGRGFNTQDGPQSTKVMLIDDVIARRYWLSQDPIGKRVTLSTGRTTTEIRQIIGVVQTVKLRSIRDRSRPTMYFPIAQCPCYKAPDHPALVPALLIRAHSDHRALIPAIHSLIESSPQPMACEVETLADQLYEMLYPQRVITGTLTLLGLIGILLSATGTYGVLAYMVRQRTREIGIRMALGAIKREIMIPILCKGFFLSVIGLVLGLGLSLCMTRILQLKLSDMRQWDRNFLFGVHTWDLMTFVFATLVMAIVTLLACYIPARRAAKIDPMEALRYE